MDHSKLMHRCEKICPWVDYCHLCHGISFDSDSAEADALSTLGYAVDYGQIAGAICEVALEGGLTVDRIDRFSSKQWVQMPLGACAHNARIAGIGDAKVEVIYVGVKG